MSRSGNVIALTVARAVGTISAIGIAAVVSRMLDKEQYGTYRQTLLIYTIAAPLISLGLPAALLYFASRDKERRRAILLENMYVTGALLLAFALFCLVPGAFLFPKILNNDLLVNTVLLLGLFAAGQILLTTFESFLVACGRAPLSAIVSAAARVATLVGVCSVAFWMREPFPIVVAQSMISASAGAVAIAIMFYISRGSELKRPTMEGGRAQLGYALPLGIAVVIDTLSLAVDKVYVSILRPTEEYAVFVNGAMEIPLIGAITTAVGAVMLPDIAKAFLGKDSGAALDLWKLSIRRVAFVLFPLGCALLAFSDELIVGLYSDSFSESAIPFRIYLLILPARAIFFGLLFRAAGSPGLVIKRSVFGLAINAVITYPFVLWFGTNGAAWATVVSFWVFVIPFSLGLCCKLMRVRIGEVLPWGFMVGLLALGAVSVGVALVLELLCDPWPFVAALLVRLIGFSAVMLAGLRVFFREDFSRFISLVRRVKN